MPGFLTAQVRVPGLSADLVDAYTAWAYEFRLRLRFWLGLRLRLEL